MATDADKLLWSFAATLAGGILVLVGALGMLGMMGFFMSAAPFGEMEGPFAMMAGMMAFAVLFGVAAGVTGIVAAVKIRNRPQDAHTWGIVAIVAGAVSLLGMGGGMIGAAALIIGGVLAMSAGSPASSPPPRQGF